MQTAIDHMKDYTAAVKNGESDLTDYTHSFENDFNALTGLASLYNQLEGKVFIFGKRELCPIIWHGRTKSGYYCG